MNPRKFAAALLLLGLGAVACGGSGGGGTGGGVTPGKKIAFLAPDATPRFEQQDLPLFQAKVRSLCSDCQVVYSNANGDSALQEQQANAALAGGANVLVLDAVQPSLAYSIVTAAAKRHVPVIAYDRLIVNTAALAYYVSFDSATVGALQGSALLSAMKGSAKPTVVMIHGDPADLEAKVLKQAAHGALDGKVTVAREYDTPSWSADGAQKEMAQALAALSNKVDGVYAANDDVASGVVLAMKAAKLKSLPPVTGGDAELSAVQRILAGEQYMTVYRPVRQEAEAAATLAYDLAFGVRVPADVTGGRTADNGARSVPAVLVQPVSVTRKTMVSTVIADGFWSRAQLCTAEYAQACKAAGLS